MIGSEIGISEETNLLRELKGDEGVTQTAFESESNTNNSAISASAGEYSESKNLLVEGYVSRETETREKEGELSYPRLLCFLRKWLQRGREILRTKDQAIAAALAAQTCR